MKETLGRITCRSLFASCVLALSVFSSSCAGGSENAGVIVRDSAGVTIVENNRVDAGRPETWRLLEPPEIELGVDEGNPNQQFNNVVGAGRLSDGRIVVADGGSKEVRYFDELGGHLVTVGGPGEGPGEFRSLLSLDRLPGDTIVAGGWPVGWAAVFDRDGNYVRNTRLGPFFPSLIGHFLPDGAFLMDVYPRGGYGNEIEWYAAYGDEGIFRPEGHIVRITQDEDASFTDTLRTILGGEWFKTGKLRQGLVLHETPFPRNTLVAWTPDRLYVGETGKPEIEVLRLDGSLERLIRWESDAVPVTSLDRGEFRDEVLGGLRGRQQSRRADFERWLADVPHPTSKPAFRSLETDPSKRLWVQAWSEAAAERDVWTVFSSDGIFVARVDVPAGLTLLEIGEEYVVALWKDNVELEYVRIYRLEKSQAM